MQTTQQWSDYIKLEWNSASRRNLSQGDTYAIFPKLFTTCLESVFRRMFSESSTGKLKE